MEINVHSFQVPGAPDQATLVEYIPTVSPEIDPDIRRPAVVVCPGGGYHFLSDREAEPIVIRLLAQGYNAFLLNYHVELEKLYPIPQLEAAYAVNYVKTNAERTHTDPERVFIMGFSAGGHLAGSLGILWNRADWADQLSLPRQAIRPAGMVLSYPVVTSGVHAHQNSFIRLLGDRLNELKDDLSLEKQVTADAAPAFIWHTFEDALVPVENALLLATALRGKGVPFELHIYPKGPHGLSLATDIVNGPNHQNRNVPECTDWIDKADRWMKSL